MNRTLARSGLLVAGALLLGSPARGQTCYPMVSRVEPGAIQRGQSAEMTVSGTQSFAGASAVLFEGTGLVGKVIEADSSSSGRRTSSVRIRVEAAADAVLGPREFRVVTPQGVSSVADLVVVADPVAPEADDKANDQPAHAQPLTLPAVACGVIGKAEDVDWYQFDLEAGRRVTFQVWGNRLENKIHDLQTHFDPIVILHDATGRELAADDNAQFADPSLSFEVPSSGPYYLEIRDTTYAGNANWTYVLQATTGPVVSAVFPMAVTPGSRATLSVWGANLEPSQSLSFDIPGDLRDGAVLLPIPTPKGLTLPVPLVATRLPLSLETDDAAAEPDAAPALAVPSALSGRLATPNDVDAYRFEARKGDVFEFEVTARRAGSAADPLLRIVDAQGQNLTQMDDTFGKDPRLEWTAPRDGSFAVVVRDLHSRGGETFGYVLLSAKSTPDFTLTCDPDKFNIGPGARTTAFVKVERRGGFNGPVTMAWQGLPPGVSASALTIPPAMTSGEVVLAAAPDAPLGGALVRLEGSAELPSGRLTRQAQPLQEIYLPGGGRGTYRIETMAVAVTAPSDITLEATPSEIVLKPGTTATIDVTVKRREGFTGPVNLAIDLAHLGRVYGSGLPPGVTVKAAGSKTLLDDKTSTGKIILEAKPEAAPCEKVPIAVMGHVSINFVVKTAYSSAPIQLTVPAAK